MRIFENISNCIHYYLDSLNAIKISAKIEFFQYENKTDSIIVVYRLGRQKLLNKIDITSFENEYFDKISNYDKNRVVKFSTLQYLLKFLFIDENCKKESLIKLIRDELINEQLF